MKHPTVYQYPFPRIPDKWSEEERRFANGLRELFDQLFARRILQDENDGHIIRYAGKAVKIPDNDTKYSAATQSKAGLMSANDKKKLDGVEAGAEANVNADWSAASGDAQILNKPTALSDFTNDQGFITQAAVESDRDVLVDCGTVSSLPKTVNDTKITAEMTVVWFEMSNPAAFTGNLTVTTAAGKVTVSGTVSGSSTLKLKLSHTA